MSELREAVERAAAVIRQRGPAKPKVAVVLGTGLGAVADQIRGGTKIPYADIPGFVRPTVATHAGHAVVGTLEGCPILALAGRFHFYEGYGIREITFPIRVARALGAEVLVVSGACGGMNPAWERGDLVILDDHINLMGVNPLIGPNDDALGPRYPDMAAPYDAKLRARLEALALAEGVRAHRGVYVAVSGPNLETRAEYRFLRTIGADVVGMSIVPEVLVAVHAGLRVAGLAVVTDQCLPDALGPAKIEDIIACANAAEPKMSRLVARLCADLARGTV